MPLPPSQDFASSADLPDVNEEVAAARQALLRFAAAEGVLEELLEGVPGRGAAYPDLEAVRRHATVDELLHLIARIPEAAEERQGYEATALYASLLQLSEAFDILIDQYSLVYGDAVALAEAMQSAWHSLGGCSQADAATEAASDAPERMQERRSATNALLGRAERLSGDERRAVAHRLGEAAGEPWTVEARRLALHAVDTCLAPSVDDPSLDRALEPARRHPASATTAEPQQAFDLALADLLLARLTEGLAHPAVSRALGRPFAGLLSER